MSKTLLEQAVADAKSIREAAEKVVKAEMLEQMVPHIKALVNKRLLMEEDDKSAEKEAIEDEDPMEAPTDGFEQSDESEKQVSQEPNLVKPAMSTEPSQEPTETPSMPGEMADSLDQPTPTSDMPSEMPEEPVPSEDFSDVPPEAASDVPPADFDDELTIELKPMVSPEGGIEDLPEENKEGDEMSNDIKESFLKRKSIREALDEIPELKASTDEEGIVSEEFSLKDIPEEERIEEDVNLTLNFSDSDSEESDLPNFLKDEKKEESEMTEERFVEEAKKLYRKKMEEKKATKKGLKEFYIPSEVGFKYGKEDVNPEKDSHLFPEKKEVHFNKVLPPEIKKWIVEADKKIKMYDKQLSEQTLVSHQMRLLVKGLIEHNIGKKGFIKLVEALDAAKSVNESNKTFAKVIKEGFGEDETFEVPETKTEEDKTEDSINESQVLRFRQLAKING